MLISQIHHGITQYTSVTNKNKNKCHSDSVIQRYRKDTLQDEATIIYCLIRTHGILQVTVDPSLNYMEQFCLTLPLPIQSVCHKTDGE